MGMFDREKKVRERDTCTERQKDSKTDRDIKTGGLIEKQYV